MIGFHRRTEGSPSYQGINWEWSDTSEPVLIVKLGLLMFYFRRRSRKIMAEWEGQKPRRCSWGFSVLPWSQGLGVLQTDFDTRTVRVGKKTVAWDLLLDLSDRGII